MRRITWLVVATLWAVAAAGCDSGDPGDGLIPRTPLGRPTDTEALVIGLVGTITGPDAWRGEDAFEGADLAVHELNASIPEGRPPFRLVTLDDEGDPEEALSSVSRLSELENLVGVVYAGPPEVLPEAEGALAARGVPAMLLYGDLYSARRLSKHVFQMSPPVLWQARRIVAYATEDRRYERVGALVRNSPLGAVAARSLRGSAADQSVRRPKIVRYEPDDPASALERLADAHTEAIVVQGSPRDFDAVLWALEAMGASYTTTAAARISSAPRALAAARRASGWWAPQVMMLDLGFWAGSTAAHRPGTVIAETYARGAYYLPVPSFRRFRAGFEDWWAKRPLGWQQRAYDAVRAIGWAVDRASPGKDIAAALEGLRGERFGALDVTFGPDDHTAVDAPSLGLWVVPAPGAAVREADGRPQGLPWVPLARGFSIDGETLDIASQDWNELVRGAPPPGAPAPRYSRLRFGVRTGRRDPVH